MRKLLFTTLAILLNHGLLLADDAANQLAWTTRAFAIDLYHQLSTKDGNLFFSPYNISTALAMTYDGARGDTATQMAQALHFSLPADKVPGAFAALRKQLRAAQGEDKVTLNIANSIWPSKQYKLLDSYVNLVTTSYGAKPTPLDYSNPDAARAIINTWVEDKTHQKIKDLIGPRILKPNTPLVLVNAIYFYGKWASAFQPKNTKQWMFQSTPEKTDKVEMMQRTSSFRFADLETIQVLELPYLGNDISMFVVLPKRRTAWVRLNQSYPRNPSPTGRASFPKLRSRFCCPSSNLRGEQRSY